MRWDRVLAAAVVMGAGVMLGQWGSPSPATAASRAEVPAAFNQTERTLEELRAMNSKLDRLIGLLEGGKLQVTVNSTDEGKAEKK